VRAHAEGVASDPTVARHAQEAADQVLENAYLHYAAAKLVTDDMLSARYDAEFKGKPGPDEVHARVILVPTEAEAQDIIAKLAAGADFATLARQSRYPAVANSGGDIGFVRRTGLNPEVAAVLFALRPGETAAYPVETPIGWFVLRAEARRTAPTPTFAEARDRLHAESEAALVPVVMKAALTGLTVRTYDMTGH
jgi:peptidyl-prolyl cis-trans isomerase C